MSDNDSRPDTYAHIGVVRSYLNLVVVRLLTRAHTHDASKLVPPEVEVFDEFGPKLAATSYGDEDYESNRAAMGEALKHHYAANSHHPEHYADGIHGMDLLDLIEMLCDWKAATLRHPDGDLDQSITQNRERFGYGDEIEGLLRLTAQRLGLIPGQGPSGLGSGEMEGSDRRSPGPDAVSVSLGVGG